MDGLGVLDKFSDAFDIEEYKKNRSDNLRFMVKQRMLENKFYESSYQKLRKQYGKEIDNLQQEYSMERLIRKVDTLNGWLAHWREYVYIFEQSVNEEKMMKNILVGLKNEGIRSIAFYGDGELRRFFWRILKDTDIEVDYIVEDGNFDWLPFWSVPRRAERLDKTDLIILTDVFASQRVIEKIQRAEIKFMTAKDMLKLALKN